MRSCVIKPLVSVTDVIAPIAKSEKAEIEIEEPHLMGQ